MGDDDDVRMYNDDAMKATAVLAFVAHLSIKEYRAMNANGDSSGN